MSWQELQFFHSQIIKHGQRFPPYNFHLYLTWRNFCQVGCCSFVLRFLSEKHAVHYQEEKRVAATSFVVS